VSMLYNFHFKAFIRKEKQECLSFVSIRSFV
jgi:hypothetical protein